MSYSRLRSLERQLLTERLTAGLPALAKRFVGRWRLAAARGEQLPDGWELFREAHALRLNPPSLKAAVDYIETCRAAGEEPAYNMLVKILADWE